MADIVEKYRIVGENATAAAFNSILRDSQNTANRISGIFKRAFAGVSLLTLARGYADTVAFHDELDRGAQKSGIATRAYTELAFAARQLEVDQGDLAVGLKTMQQEIENARGAADRTTPALLNLGLTFEELDRLEPDKQFELIADRIYQLGTASRQTDSAVEFFGRQGANLLPLFQRGAQGIREAREEAVRFGQSLSDEQLETFRKADNAVDQMAEAWRRLKQVLALEVSPAFTEIADKIIVATGHGSDIQNLEVRLRDLKNTLGSGIPVYFNFGYIAGAPVVMGPDDLRKKIGEIEAALASLRGGAGATAAPAIPLLEAVVVTGDKWSKTIQGMQPFLVTATRANEDYAASLARTGTEAQQAAAQYIEFRGALEHDLASGQLGEGQAGIDEFNKRLSDFISRTIPDVEVTAKRMVVEREISKMSVFAEEAARNVQTAFANFLFDPFQDGLDGMLKGFIDVLRRMLAEAASAKLLEALGLGKSGGGILGSILGGIFGGGTAAAAGGSSFRTVGMPMLAGGGTLGPGGMAIVGDKGPELAIAGRSGATIAPMRAGRGGNLTIDASMHVDARGASVELQKVLPSILRKHADYVEQRVVSRIRRNVYSFSGP